VTSNLFVTLGTLCRVGSDFAPTVVNENRSHAALTSTLDVGR